ncbi:hypothetical protein, partial [Pseudomonas cyclaminis]|uniref:hypothetical protein n=1 Tax=Pseudomonas cyclaminis TaxID=2781239 RepID=UPI0019D655BF
SQLLSGASPSHICFCGKLRESGNRHCRFTGATRKPVAAFLALPPATFPQTLDSWAFQKLAWALL